MMQAAISAIDFDPSGAVLLALIPETDFGETRRRMNRIATLDGGAAVNDFGFSFADRTVSLVWRPDAALDALVARLVRLYGRLRLATDEGVFLVAPEVHRTEADRSTLRVLVLERLTT
jgi:hypothetical protein